MINKHNTIKKEHTYIPRQSLGTRLNFYYLKCHFGTSRNVQLPIHIPYQLVVYS
jgi:hypothetical protein